MSGKTKNKGGKRWVQELETKDTVDESEGTFSGSNTAEEIAIELKRKAPNFQAAVGKITLYLNRAGKRLSKSRIKELERVPAILRDLYNRKDRQRANHDRSIKVDISKKKASSNKIASMWGQWEDEQGTVHIGDQFSELLLVDEENFNKSDKSKGMSWDDLEDYRDFILRQFGYPIPSNKETKNHLLSLARKKLMDKMTKDEDTTEIPIWEIDKSMGIPKKKGWIVAPSLIASEVARESGEREMIFASEKDALQYLADIMGEPIYVKKIQKD